MTQQEAESTAANIYNRGDAYTGGRSAGTANGGGDEPCMIFVSEIDWCSGPQMLVSWSGKTWADAVEKMLANPYNG